MPTTELRPTMQAAMWRMRRDGEINNDDFAVATLAALVRRGLASQRHIGRMRIARYNLTDAGRAWLAEQIESAYVDALDIEADRTHRAFMAHGGVDLLAAADLADRNVVRAHRMPISEAFLVEDDHAEALRHDDVHPIAA